MLNHHRSTSRSSPFVQMWIQHVLKGLTCSSAFAEMVFLHYLQQSHVQTLGCASVLFWDLKCHQCLLPDPLVTGWRPGGAGDVEHECGWNSGGHCMQMQCPTLWDDLHEGILGSEVLSDGWEEAMEPASTTALSKTEHRISSDQYYTPWYSPFFLVLLSCSSVLKE